MEISIFALLIALNQVWFISSYSKQQYPPHRAFKLCVAHTKINFKDAKTLLKPFAYPENKVEMCFLECYFAKSEEIIVGEVVGKRKGPGTKPGGEDISFIISIGSKRPQILQQCIDESVYSGLCEIGLVQRLCHMKYTRFMASNLAILFKNNKI
uniref:Uncharacterized protein n=1 Tax=Clastoptera arizonana TaxID=38151 RepID=A0A1B6CYT1_9HEMI